MSKYLKYLFQLILSPGHGWEDIETSGISASRVASAGYYPLIAVTAVSVFVQSFYHSHEHFLKLFMDMIVTFAVYFVSYFFATFMLSLFVEPMLSGKYDEDKCHIFSLFSLGLLAVANIIVNCLPVGFAELFFLPIYVALIQWKGATYMEITP
ncbi:MAG: hypothetical protein K2H05_07625, partial [Duncaniella sp.]|nr:hypothetical protein [Duncaniella sp.]